MIARLSVGVLAGRTLRLATPLYLATLLVALLPGLVGLAGLGMIAGDRPWRTELLGPGWANLFLEMLGSAVYQGGSLGFSLMLVAGLLLLPLAMLAQLVVYSFLAGGILARLTTGPDDQHVPFLAACRRWFWASLRLSLFGGVILMAVATITGAFGVLAGRLVGQDAVAVVQFLAHALVLGWLELARAAMITAGRSSVRVGLRLASPALLKPLVLLVWALLAVPPLGLTLAALTPPPVADPLAVTDLLLALGYGQLVAFLSAWSKVVRLAVAARLAAGWKAAAPVAA